MAELTFASSGLRMARVDGEVSLARRDWIFGWQDVTSGDWQDVTSRLARLNFAWADCTVSSNREIFVL